MPNSELQLQRAEITDGFVMPGFKGCFYMWPEEYWLLSKYLDMTKGDYLEIGSMCGIIAMSFAERYPHRRFVCVDKFSGGHGTIAGERETFFLNLQEHDLRNVTLLEGDSLAVVPEIPGCFDLIFVDANHAYDYVLGDAMNTWRLLSRGGFIAFHDYGYVEETTRAVNDFLRRTGGRFLESASCLAIVQKLGDRENDTVFPVRAGLRQYLQTQLLSQTDAVKENARKLQDDFDRLLGTKKVLEEETAQLAVEKGRLEVRNRELEARTREFEAVLRRVENSVSYRMLSPLRNIRNRLRSRKNLS